VNRILTCSDPHEKNWERFVQFTGLPFKPAGATTTVGAPSFAHVAKGGYQTANSEWFCLKDSQRTG